MVNTTKFVQVGERSKGRIRKNESFTVDKFIDTVLPAFDIKNPKVTLKISMLDMFNLSKLTSRVLAYTEYHELKAVINQRKNDRVILKKKILEIIKNDN